MAATCGSFTLRPKEGNLAPHSVFCKLPFSDSRSLFGVSGSLPAPQQQLFQAELTPIN